MRAGDLYAMQVPLDGGSGQGLRRAMASMARRRCAVLSRGPNPANTPPPTGVANPSPAGLDRRPGADDDDG